MLGTIVFEYEAEDTDYDSQDPKDIAREDQMTLELGPMWIYELLEVCTYVQVSIRPAVN